ncbi:MAG: sulfatase [Bryobacteraceae bacterium]
MNRRKFVAAMAGAAGAQQPAPASRPNVLFLSVDDMNDWVGCLRGYPRVRTPNIDALARRGVLFSDAHCASPLCNPSRTALFTGMAASTTGVYDNETYWKPNLPWVTTLPEYFKNNGYHVAGAGKVFHHVAGFNPPDQWNEFQLQQFDDPWYRRTEWYPWVKKVPNPQGHPFNGLKNFQGEFDWGVLPYKEQEYGDMRAVDYARQFLVRKHEKPFLLAIGLWHPHIPMFAPQSYFDLYPPGNVRLPKSQPNDLDDVPEAGKKMAAFRRDEHERIVKEGKWRDAVRAYLAAISFADAMIGMTLRALDESAYAQNTVIVFWSDNGWHLGEKQHWHKSTLWQRSTHVPLIFAGPGSQSAGKARTQPVSLLDLYPTLVEMCGLPAKSDLEGTSLVPLLQDPAARRNPVVSTYLQGNHAVIDERWRYIQYKDGSEELYDRRKDPNEFRNLAGEARLGNVRQELAKWMPKRNAAPKPDREAFVFDFPKYSYSRKP